MKYFKENEFANYAMLNDKLVVALDAFREDLGAPITITADYAADGHSPNSMHYQGKAIDGTCQVALDAFIKKAIKYFTGIGLYMRDGRLAYFHVDVRDTAPQMWVCEVKATGYNYVYKIG